jgi:hypothetical protein
MPAGGVAGQSAAASPAPTATTSVVVVADAASAQAPVRERRRLRAVLSDSSSAHVNPKISKLDPVEAEFTDAQIDKVRETPIPAMCSNLARPTSLDDSQGEAGQDFDEDFNPPTPPTPLGNPWVPQGNKDTPRGVTGATNTRRDKRSKT